VRSARSRVSNDVQSLEPNGRRERVAAKSRTVRSGREHVHDLASSDKRRDRQNAAAERLPQDQPVGRDALVLERKPGAGAAKPRLNLIEDEQYVIRAAKLTHRFEPTRRWNDNPGLTLDRLDQHGDRLGR
jgi:hypothetical protein